MFKAMQTFYEPSLYFFSLSISFIRDGFQTTERYSSTGHTYVLKATIKDEIFLDSKHRKIKLAFMCAFTHILDT